MPMLLPFISR